jgi:hypothetical protein
MFTVTLKAISLLERYIKQSDAASLFSGSCCVPSSCLLAIVSILQEISRDDTRQGEPSEMVHLQK